MIFRSFVFASLGALLISCQSAAQTVSPSTAAAPRDTAVATALAQPAPTPAGSPDFATVAARILPSVVRRARPRRRDLARVSSFTSPAWARVEGFGCPIRGHAKGSAAVS